ncbi:ribonuclease J [Bacillaceae bacterium Marseille-Q3522]|nr:ribonuclease J [Bacillaceae bacterium Marseille-Q3522]
MKKRNNESIKLVALGGVGEIGKNMFLVEVDKDIFVIDAGLMFPENEMLGIDIVIPDITYLKENQERVKGIFLTHGHEDHIGALSYVLRELSVPVYGMKLTLALAKEKMKVQDYNGHAEFIEIQADSVLDFDTATISFFRTNHSIPDSVGICIHTSAGSIVHTGDFKFDQAAGDFYKADIGRMSRIGEEGVLCLLSDSTDAEKPGYTPSEALLSRELVDTFYRAQGRIIAACYASDLNRIQHIFDAASLSKRKIAVVGKSLQRIFEIALPLQYLKVEENPIISAADLDQYPDNQVLVLITGDQGEPIEALQKMAKNTHKQVSIKEGDTVLFVASPLTGSELFINRTIDMLVRAGASVERNRLFTISSHGSQEELKFMINLMNPKYFMPIHGDYSMLKAHTKIAKECGIAEEAIMIPEKGEVIEWKKDHFQPGERISAFNVLIDGSGIGDVGNIVLRDRKLLSQDGILIVVVTLNKKEKKISAGPEIISRGFVYVRESEKLLDEAAKRVSEIVQQNIAQETFDWSALKQNMRDELNQYLYEKTKRRPMILPIIMEI